MSKLPLCEAWFEVEPFDDALTRLTEPHVHVLLRSNIWLVRGRDRDLVVDTGNGLSPLRPVIDRLRGDRDKPLAAVATHGHMDHACGLREFDERLLHPADAAEAADPHPLLLHDDVWPGAREQMAEAGYPVPEILLEAEPSRGFDPRSFRPPGSAPTRTIGDGDTLDLGDRSFDVLHLPGHTNGSVGLWDGERGELFSGDAVYLTDPLLDTTPTSDVASYVDTMRRLRELPVRIVYAGHDASFDRDMLKVRCEAYIEARAPSLDRG